MSEKFYIAVVANYYPSGALKDFDAVVHAHSPLEAIEKYTNAKKPYPGDEIRAYTIDDIRLELNRLEQIN